MEILSSFIFQFLVDSLAGKLIVQTALQRFALCYCVEGAHFH